MNIKTKKEEREQSKEIKEHRHLFPVYIIILLAALISYLLIRFNIFSFTASTALLAKKISLAILFASLVLLVADIIEKLVKQRTKDITRTYNIIRIIRLTGVLVIALITISFLNQNWYAAAVSLGLISLVLGFALQSPIASFIGWFYIIIRTPYKVGDRIQTGDLTGDVVEINYLDTTLWEFGGNYMSNDIATGRLIRFPNSLVWQQAVYNYSWHKFPYIWNEIPFHIAYESNLNVIEKIMRDAYEELFGHRMKEEVIRLNREIKKTPVDEPDVTDYPVINFRVNDNTWVEALIIYLVEPKEAAIVQSMLIKRILKEFLLHPNEILFPKSNSR